MKIFDPIAVPVPLGSVLTASNVAEDEASAWAAPAWAGVAAAEANTWFSVAYGNGVWIAVATTGTNRTMRSVNGGVSWSAVAAAEANAWESVAYGDGVWIAVASTGTNRVMRSVNDGVSWSAVAAAEANSWQSVAYGGGVWVAVANSGTNRVMRSVDGGSTWTAVAAIEVNTWQSVAYGDGVFVAVADQNIATGFNRVMRSTNGGATWSGVAAAEQNSWNSVAYGDGAWIAVSSGGTNRVMRSTDGGATWKAIAAAEQNIWQGVAYGGGAWVAVGFTGTNLAMRSVDGGLTWAAEAESEDILWRSVAYGAGVWIAVANTGTNRTMKLVTYTAGQEAIYTPDKHLYEVLADSTIDTPAAGVLRDPPTWLDLGFINRWKMFDEAVTLQTTKAISVDVTIAPGISADAVAAMNVSGYSVQVIRASTGYNVETVLNGKTDLVFLLPTKTTGSIQVIVWGDAAHTGGTAKIGELLIGASTEFGFINSGSSVGITDFSKKTTDAFGNLTVVERAFSKRASFDMTIYSSEVDALQSFLAALRATPAVYIGVEEYSSTIVYGFYRSFTIVIGGPTRSACSLEVEGLT